MSTNKAVPGVNIWKMVGLSMVFGSALAFAACSTPAAPAAQPTVAEATATTAEATATTVSASETTTTTESTTPTEVMTATEEMTATTEAESATPTEEITSTTTTTETEGASATETLTTSGTTTETGSTTGESMLMVKEDAKYGNILVDDKGMTLYVFDKDTAGTSTCTGNCLTNWPPFTVASEQTSVMAGEGITATFGVITRDDGTYQVTINDMPLYYYAKDTAAGDTNGQAVGDVWWVVGADGNKVTTQ